MKFIIWLMIGSVLFFGGWIIKDYPYLKPVGQFAMAIGFLIFALLLASLIWKDVYKK